MKKFILGFILGAISVGCITVYATSLVSGSDVNYDNTSTNLSSTDVNGAITELYSMVNNNCPTESVVTYIVDGNSYEEVVAKGNDVLNPTTFTPVKSDYYFLGWSTVEDGIVLNSLTATGRDITLYSIWQYVADSNLTSGTISLNPNADDSTNYTAAGWLNGSKNIYAVGQKITVTYSNSRYSSAIGGYLDIYIRNASTGTRTRLGRVDTKTGYASEGGWGSGSGTIFYLPDDKNYYYVDYYGWGIGYYTGTHNISWTISSTKISYN